MSRSVDAGEGIDAGNDSGSRADSGGSGVALMCPAIDLSMGCHDENDCGRDGDCDPYATSSSTCGGAQLLSLCSTDEECEGGLICEAQSAGCQTYLDCVVGCTEISCGETRRCEAGRCEQILCDEAGGPACAEVERCNPSGASANHLGCEAVPCTEPAIDCADGYSCDAEAVGVDRHGCSRIHCSDPEALPCASGQRCDSDTAGSGCVMAHCTEPEGRDCAVNECCEQESSNASGCVQLTCQVAADCDCGLCIKGACFNRPGQCQYFAP